MNFIFFPFPFLFKIYPWIAQHHRTHTPELFLWLSQETQNPIHPDFPDTEFIIFQLIKIERKRCTHDKHYDTIEMRQKKVDEEVMIGCEEN